MLGWVFNSLSRHAALWVKEWTQTSVDRKRMSYPFVERTLRCVGEHPGLFVALIWLAAVGATVGCGWASPKYVGLCLVPANWKESDLLAYFSTLWTIQATVAALVYPIVIAFVAVLLQRRTTAKLSLRLYALDAAVVPAGTSAIALLTWMGIEYFLLPYISTNWIVAAMVGNSAWFVANSLLTGWFLYRTVRYLNDESRLEVFTRFAVQVAFPREVRRHLLGLIFSHAQTHKLVPGRDFTSDEKGPKVLLYPMLEGRPCITVHLNKEQAIADVRLRLLAWGVSLWLRKAEKVKGAPPIGGLESEYPLLEIPITPGDTVEGEVPLCRVRDGAPPGAVASFLIRHSVVFGPPPRPYTSYSTTEILEELAVEALALVEQKRFEAAAEAVRGLADLHAELIRSGRFINDNGEEDNAALLRDPYGFGSQRIHEVWLRVYRQLAETAVRDLPLDSSVYDQHCYLTCRLVSSLRGQHLDILAYLLHISTLLMYRLGIWWSAKIEERGLAIHNALHGVVLPLPLVATYDRALQTFIGGWEAIELWEHGEETSNAEEAWARHSRHARFVAVQAEQTVRMLLGAVVRGDRAAALWLADSFLKCWDKHLYYFDWYHGNGGQNRLLTFACADKKWSDVRELLDAVPEGEQEATTAGEVIATVLRRYWSDLRLVLILILLDWTPADAPKDAFALELAMALLQGRNLKHGGRVDADAFTNTSPVLFRLMRIQLANREYEQMLDKVVESAQELRKPSMVSGRIYSYSGVDDVESLCLAQTQMLAAITAATIEHLPELMSAAKAWAHDLRQLQRFKRLAQLLADCTVSNAFNEKISVTAAIRHAVGLPDNLDEARGWINETFKDLANLAAQTYDKTLEKAKVSQARLNEVAKEVSDYVLGSDNKVFPFTLAPALEAVFEAGEPRSLSISGVDKAPYTDPPLESGSSSFLTWSNKYVAEAVGRNLVMDYLKATGATPLRDDSSIEFFADMASRADSLRSQGYLPLLIVSSQHAPEWVYPWRYQREATERPSNVSVRARKSEDVASLLGYFNDVPVHRVPLAGKNCYVIPKEHFHKLMYTIGTDDSCIAVNATGEENHKLRLKFEWSFRSASV